MNLQKIFLNVIVGSSLVAFLCCSGSKQIMRKEIGNIGNVYTVGRKYVFSYEYTDSVGVVSKYQFYSPFYQTNISSEKNVMESWGVVTVKDDSLSESEIVDELHVDFVGGQVNGDQSTIIISYVSENGNKILEEATGIIQTPDRVWFHPPRKKSFAILELVPFPEIRMPLVVGRRWESLLTVGDLWSSPKWNEWVGDINIRAVYEITKKFTIDLFGQEVVCYEVSSKNLIENKIISSSEFFFTREFGFVKMTFHNINKSKIVLQLESIKNISSYK